MTAAADQFRANGFEASSMDKIAASAGVSKRTVYNHFPSKEDLFAETLIELYSGSATILEVPYRSDAPLREQLTALMALKAASMADPQFLALSKVAIAEAVHAPERVRPLVARLGEREQGVTTWIRAAQADGRIKAGDPEFAAALLQGQVKALAFWPQMTLDVPPLTPAQQAALVEAAVSMFLSYFAVANETA